jgi:hypothetical protein
MRDGYRNAHAADLGNARRTAVLPIGGIAPTSGAGADERYVASYG